MADPFSMSTIFPCWGKHQRMGHNTVVGEFRAMVGTSAVCQVPPVDGDAQHDPSPGRTLLLPMDGPAFYGFEVIPEADARAYLAARRMRSWSGFPVATLPAPVEVVPTPEGLEVTVNMAAVRSHVTESLTQLGRDSCPHDGADTIDGGEPAAAAPYEIPLPGRGEEDDDVPF